MEASVLELLTQTRFHADPQSREWESVVSADPAGSVFSTPRFLQVWWEHLGGTQAPRIRFACDGDRIIGVVPEVRDGATARFAGGEEVTDYLGPVSLPDHRSEVVTAWLGALAAEDDWDEVVASGLPEDAGWHELLAHHADAHGLVVKEADLDAVCPRIDLDGGWDAYLARLTGKQRHELGRKARKLAREAGSVTVREAHRDDLDGALDAFVALHRSSEGAKARFFVDARKRAFFAALVDEFGDDDVLRIHRLDIAGQAAAVTLSLVYGGEWGLNNSAFDQSLRSLAPGMVLVGELIRMAADGGARVFDLLRGDEEYKYRFGAVDRRVRRVVLTRR